MLLCSSVPCGDPSGVFPLPDSSSEFSLIGGASGNYSPLPEISERGAFMFVFFHIVALCCTLDILLNF